MTSYAWPFPVNAFEMRIMPNTRVFTGPYTPTTQVLDMLGERWAITLTLPPLGREDTIYGARREAFFDRLKGPANTITMGHLKLTAPQGTMGAGVGAVWQNSSAATATWQTASSASAAWVTGPPVIDTDIAQLANTGVIRTRAGKTLLAGDLLGLGGQLVRIMADAAAGSDGRMPIEFQPRARQLIPGGSLVTYESPTATFMLKPGTSNVPTSWTPDGVDGASIDLIEIF